MCIEFYRNIKDEVVGVSSKYLPEHRVKAFSQHIDDKLENFMPSMMVYGVYNAGKSTLINAIFAKDELAKTGDAPETSRVYAYHYQGFTIFDTPGINAPIEHEEVTQAQLEKCELVLFVMSSDGSFEEAYVYQRIGEIIAQGKPVLIVINNKNGLDKDSADAMALIDKVNVHLSVICDAAGVERAEEKVRVVFVDAKTALEGRLEQEEELIEESNYKSFESMMNLMLGSSGKEEVKNALNLFVSNYIHDVLTVIDQKIDNPELRAVQEMVSYLEKTRQSAVIELKDMANQIILAAINRMFMSLQEGTNFDGKRFVEEVTTEIKSLVQQKAEQLRRELEGKARLVAGNLKDLDIEATDFNGENASEPAGVREVDIGKVGAGGAVVALAQVIPPTLTFGPVPVKPLVMAVGALLSVFASSGVEKARAQAALEAERRRYLMARNRADEFGMKLKPMVNGYIIENMDLLFSPAISTYMKVSEKMAEENRSLLEDKRMLNSVLERLDD